MANLKTVKKWETSLKCKVDILEIANGKVVRIKCTVCTKHESQIKHMKGFNQAWIDGTESVKKDSLEKHLKGDPHKTAKDLELKSTLGASPYQEKVVSQSPIGRGLTKMREADKEVRTFHIEFIFKTKYIFTENLWFLVYFLKMLNFLVWFDRT